MAGSITQEGITYLLNLMRGGESPVVTYYVALVANLPPGFTIGGDELDEPDFAEYARGEIVNDSGSWDVDGTLMTNAAEITFPTALTEWGQIRYWALLDSPQVFGGRVLFAGEVDDQTFVSAGDQVFLAPGELGIDLGSYQWTSAS